MIFIYKPPKLLRLFYRNKEKTMLSAVFLALFPLPSPSRDIITPIYNNTEEGQMSAPPLYYISNVTMLSFSSSSQRVLPY